MTGLGTPRELMPVAEQVLAWVANQKARLAKWDRIFEQSDHVDYTAAQNALQPRRDTLRRIELCALATIEAAMFYDLYGGGDYAPSTEVQGQRGAPEGVSREEEEA